MKQEIRKNGWLALVFGGLLILICLGNGLWRATPFTWKVGSETAFLLSLGAAKNYLEKQDWAKAEESVFEAKAALPNHYASYEVMGDIYAARRQYQQAADAYEKALSLCGSSPTNLTPIAVQILERERILGQLREVRQRLGTDDSKTH